MFRWYVINTYSGHENKVKTNLEHRILSMNQAPRFRRVVVKTTPGVTGFVGAGAKPVPLAQSEVDRILHTGRGDGERPRAQVEFSLGESVKVTSGPLSDFDGEVVDVNADQQKLKVLVDIFERQVPVELTFDQVKKLD